MIIENISNDKQTKLFMALEANLNSLKKRNISYIITCYSDLMATITLQVNGKKGLATKIIAVNYELLHVSWVVYSENKKYILTGLSEISTITKSIVAKLSTTLTKI